MGYWVKTGVKRVLGFLLYGGYRLSDFFFEKANSVEIDGHSYRFPPERINSEVAFELVSNRYEREERQLIKRNSPRSSTVVELGAAIGVVSQTILSEWNPERLICVEADENLFPYLKANLSPDTTSVDLENCFIDYSSDDFYRNRSVFWSSSSQRPEDGVKVSDSCRMTLTEVLDKHGVDDFTLVMDLEGTERDLLVNDMETIRDRCRQILLEFHPDLMNPEVIENLKDRIVKNGFKPIEEDPRGSVCFFVQDI